MHSTNYFDTFITVSEDCPAKKGTVPPERATPQKAMRVFQMIHEHPYRYTSDDVLFAVFADRAAIPSKDRETARREFFSKAQACLRASDLPKRYGWGVHADAKGFVAVYGVDTKEYREFASGRRKTKDGKPLTIKKAMRSRR